MKKIFTCDKLRQTQNKTHHVLLVQTGEHYVLCSVPKQRPVWYTVAYSEGRYREEIWVFAIKCEDLKRHSKSVITHTPVAMKRL